MIHRCSAALACAAALAAPVHAQETDLAARVEAAIDARLAEQRVVLTCSSTFPQTHEFLLEAWQEEIDRTLDVLQETALPGILRIHLRDDAAPEAVMLPDDTPFGEVRAFCASHPDWERELRLMRYAPLFDNIPDLLAEE
ncbi:hypothetical protein P1J78_16280 [Psychromarinibacter sp. C21-152]|uniref:Uncharacterized protein n=1 Tax=Psychromarinibacter sediminicola TaxID=3033385 RepID=A0AAE3NTS8_9RHOB|nr:hypothetical protein [Psychromarinibacter sediminicola]MDF0602299.1 hypothetical protein [Psychromarinibacter sediminicola]